MTLSPAAVVWGILARLDLTAEQRAAAAVIVPEVLLQQEPLSEAGE